MAADDWLGADDPDDDREPHDREPMQCEVTVVRATDKALCCRQNDALPAEPSFWLPRSQLQKGTTVAGIGHVGLVVVPYWLSRKVPFHWRHTDGYPL